jgi:hypothetical protein
MTTTPDIKVGDEVRVYFNSRTAGQLGEVVRIGRTRLTVRVNGRNEDFYIETQQGVGPQSGYGTRFRTMADEAEYERRQTALATLKARNVEPRMGYERSFTTEQIEALAEVVKTFDQES